MARRFETGIDLRNQRGQNFASGTQPTDAVNLAQLQSAVAGLSWHGECRVGSTTNISLSSPGTTVDGVTLAIGDRVLVKNQTAASQNGIYLYQGSASAMTLAADSQQGTLNEGAAVYVGEGSVNADTAWTLTTDAPITVGTTSLTFAQFGAGIAYTAGSGLKLTGTQFSIDPTAVARHYAASLGDGSSTTYTVTHSLGTLDVLVQFVLVTTGETIEADVTRTATNTVQVVFGTAPASGAVRIVVVG